MFHRHRWLLPKSPVQTSHSFFKLFRARFFVEGAFWSSVRSRKEEEGQKSPPMESWLGGGGQERVHLISSLCIIDYWHPSAFLNNTTTTTALSEGQFSGTKAKTSMFELLVQRLFTDSSQLHRIVSIQRENPRIVRPPNRKLCRVWWWVPCLKTTSQRLSSGCPQ